MAPGAKALFTRVNVDNFESPEFNGHIMRVMGGLDVLVNYLEDTATLDSLLAHLASQHAVRAGVTKGAFEVSRQIKFRHTFSCRLYPYRRHTHNYVTATQQANTHAHTYRGRHFLFTPLAGELATLMCYPSHESHFSPFMVNVAKFPHL